KTAHSPMLPPEIWQDIWSYLKSDVIFRQALSSHTFMHYVKKHCQVLDFSYNSRVKQFPTVILDFRSLRELYFDDPMLGSGHNQFDLPPDLLVLTNLTKLSVKGFNLKHSIESILVLTSLKSLSLSLNGIKHLSEKLSLLTNLENLRFCQQYTNFLPESITTLA
ncbi:MAG TPA: hypothetical protein PKE52_15910, partial [Bacteroidales bacterium]|nr:hypothetical protein [Bacteroidales bacterium]